VSQNGYYAYYPGCSMKASAHSYDKSAKLVADALGMKLQEVEDWNCCGTTEYFSVNRIPAYSLVARNLAIAAQQGTGELTAPCSACYVNLRKTDDHLGAEPKLNAQVGQALAAGNLHYEPGSLRIRHLLDVIVEDIGYETIAEKIVQPLAGLRIAPYYGCLITRPYYDGNPEYPDQMDILMQTLGARVVDFPMKSHCCGGHMTQISEETAFELIRQLLQNAAEYEADMIVTVCPMCQLNLDAYQSNVNRAFGTNYEMPVLYFTQLMGLAFGFKAKELGIGSEITPAAKALDKIGQEDDSAKRKPKRRDKQALPMPSIQ
jgi:heterodisulfide reductase subunit B